MNISLVVAAAENNAIGKNNQLLWCLPNDMKFFKNVTWGMVVVMGRKTFESLGKPLKGRKNIVITKQVDWKAEGVVAVRSLDDALFAAKEMEVKEVFVIGGGETYKLALPRANRIYLTRVHASPEGADAFFPEFNEAAWELVSNKDYPVDEKHSYAYSFQVWAKDKYKI
ncbi:MAG: dihydrofolate reductase [Chitinophagaceae bacterium]|nr:dihydrofolate reductase [Chitinophagaceae bacterium]